MSYCRDCGNYLTANPNGIGFSWCQRCSKNVQDLIDVNGITVAIRAQADSAAGMLAALTHAHALPLTSLLQSWWDKLPVVEAKMFVRALAERCCSLVEAGILDETLKAHIRKVMTPTVVAEHVQKTLASEGDAHIMAVAAKILEKDIQDKFGDYRKGMESGIGAAVKQVAFEHTMARREVIESAVRDALPSIEEMTKKIVTDVANDMAADVSKRMKRDT